MLGLLRIRLVAFGQTVELPHFLIQVSLGPVADVNPSRFDNCADKLDALAVMLQINLPRMQTQRQFFNHKTPQLFLNVYQKLFVPVYNDEIVHIRP